MTWRRHLPGLRRPVDAYLGMGSNVGDRLATLRSALHYLDEHDRVTVTTVSGVYETEPVSDVEQEPYLNLVAGIRTSLRPRELLAAAQSIEAEHGRARERERRWGPRTLDVDILLYGDRTVDVPDLAIPHPRLRERAFVLVPLMEVLPAGTLPDGTRLSSLIAAIAPIEGVELAVRLDDVPGAAHRPAGPATPRPLLADEWEASRPDHPGPPPGVYR